MNQIVVSCLAGALLVAATTFSAPATPVDSVIVKAAVRECSRSFYQLGRDLTQVPQIELHDPKLFFELINERIDDQRALISIVRTQTQEEPTKAALAATDKLLDEARKRLKGVDTRDTYGDIAASVGDVINRSSPFREFFLRTLGGSKPTVGESITNGGN